MTDQDVRELLRLSPQVGHDEVAWLRQAVAAELSHWPRSYTRDAAAELLRLGRASKSDPEAATELRRRGLPVMGEAPPAVAGGGEQGGGQKAADPVLPTEAPADIDLGALCSPDNLNQLVKILHDPDTSKLLEGLARDSDTSALLNKLGEGQALTAASGAGSPLASCRRAFLALSTEDRQRFVGWMAKQAAQDGE